MKKLNNKKNYMIKVYILKNLYNNLDIYIFKKK